MVAKSHGQACVFCSIFLEHFSEAKAPSIIRAFPEIIFFHVQKMENEN